MAAEVFRASKKSFASTGRTPSARTERGGIRVTIVGSPPMTDVLIAKQQSLVHVRHAWRPS